MVGDIVLRELWIDRKRYLVEHGVTAEISRLKAMVESLTKSLEARGPAPAPWIVPANDRWTTARKQALLNAISAGLIDGVAAMTLFGVTVEELDAWHAGRTQLKAVADRVR